MYVCREPCTPKIRVMSKLSPGFGSDFYNLGQNVGGPCSSLFFALKTHWVNLGQLLSLKALFF